MEVTARRADKVVHPRMMLYTLAAFTMCNFASIVVLQGDDPTVAGRVIVPIMGTGFPPNLYNEGSLLGSMLIPRRSIWGKACSYSTSTELPLSTSTNLT